MQLICKEFTSVTKCVVRVYIIRAFNLVFPKNDGRYNPYISIKYCLLIIQLITYYYLLLL